MNSGWVFLALLSTVLSALVNILDSHLMTQRMPGWRAYILISDLFISLPISIVILIIFPLPPGIGFAPLLVVFAAAVLSSLASILILQVMKSEHISRITPLISTSPVFVAGLAFMFLGERFTLLQVLGITAVVGEAIIISFKWNSSDTARVRLRPVLMLLGAALLVAGSNVANKYAMGYMSYWNSAGLMFMISSILFLSICIRPSVAREVAGLKQRNLTIGLALGNSVVSIAVAVLAYSAVKLGPVALASAVFNSKPIFVFTFAGLAGVFFPRFLPPERLNRKTWLIKGAATLLVVSGLVAMLAFGA